MAVFDYQTETAVILATASFKYLKYHSSTFDLFAYYRFVLENHQ